MIYEPIQSELDNYYYHYLVMWDWFKYNLSVSWAQVFVYLYELDEWSYVNLDIKVAMHELDKARREIIEKDNK